MACREEVKKGWRVEDVLGEEQHQHVFVSGRLYLADR